MMKQSDYDIVMDFINARKHKNADGTCDELRGRKFQLNLKVMIFLHGLGYCIAAAFNTFPLVEYALGKSIRFPLPLYIPFDFASHSCVFYFIFYIFLTLSLHNSANLMTATCLYFNSLLEYLSNEFHMLGLSFERSMEKDDETTVETYKKLVKHHQELLR
jgi:hypothetical protein